MQALEWTLPFPALNANVLQRWTLIIESTWPFQIAVDESLGRKIPRFGLEGPACAAWRMWWWWSLRQKLQRNSRNYTSTWLFPADISGAQTRINIQIAPLFLGSRLSQQLRTSKRQIKRAMDGHSSGGIGLVKLCLKWQGYKKQGCFDVPSSQLRSAAAHRLPSSVWAAQQRCHQMQHEAPGRAASCRGSDRGRSSMQHGAVFGFVHFSMILIRVQHFFLFSPSRQI